MNNDIVIRLAQEAGLPTTMGWIDSVLRFAVAIAEVEREACAKVCEEDGLLWGQRYAAAIRAKRME